MKQNSSSEKMHKRGRFWHLSVPHGYAMAVIFVVSLLAIAIMPYITFEIVGLIKRLFLR